MSKNKYLTYCDESGVEFLRKKGWINIRKDRENEKLDQYLKEYYERQKERP